MTANNFPRGRFAAYGVGNYGNGGGNLLLNQGGGAYQLGGGAGLGFGGVANNRLANNNLGVTGYGGGGANQIGAGGGGVSRLTGYGVGVTGNGVGLTGTGYGGVSNGIDRQYYGNQQLVLLRPPASQSGGPLGGALDGLEIDYDTFVLLLGVATAAAAFALYQIILTKGRRRSFSNQSWWQFLVDRLSDLVWTGKKTIITQPLTM